MTAAEHTDKKKYQAAVRGDDGPNPNKRAIHASIRAHLKRVTGPNGYPKPSTLPVNPPLPPGSINVLRNTIAYGVYYNGPSLPAYPANSYPTLPNSVRVVTVTGVINSSIAGSILQTGNQELYRSYWFSSSPSYSDILRCVEKSQTDNGALPSTCIAVKFASQYEQFQVYPPTTIPATIYILIIPYNNTATSTFTLIVKRRMPDGISPFVTTLRVPINQPKYITNDGIDTLFVGHNNRITSMVLSDADVLLSEGVVTSTTEITPAPLNIGDTLQITGLIYESGILYISDLSNGGTVHALDITNNYTFSRVSTGLGSIKGLAAKDESGVIKIFIITETQVKSINTQTGAVSTVGSGYNSLQGISRDGVDNILIIDKNTAGALIPHFMPSNQAFFEPTGSIINGIPNVGGMSSGMSFNIYITDSINKINKIPYQASPGDFESLAGYGGVGNLDGEWAESKFDRPLGITTWNYSNVYYVADFNNNSIRKILGFFI